MTTAYPREWIYVNSAIVEDSGPVIIRYKGRDGRTVEMKILHHTGKIYAIVDDSRLPEPDIAFALGTAEGLINTRIVAYLRNVKTLTVGKPAICRLTTGVKVKTPPLEEILVQRA
jgi:hypothetical protein